ncbi:MAG: hypothetical protein QOE27_107 [Solirubrobacteraceae bacterium]|jgi:hypothetical protein|nr:hypothetical protein [Solirubrobacteraceae bacterium]
MEATPQSMPGGGEVEEPHAADATPPAAGPAPPAPAPPAPAPDAAAAAYAELATLRGRVLALEAELAETHRRANTAIAAAQERVYWLDRWHVDLNALMLRRSAVAARAVLRALRGMLRALRRFTRAIR